MCVDKVLEKKLRSILWEVVKQIGKKLLNGDTNLTRISFPIKAMSAKTAGESIMYGCNLHF